MRRLLFLSCLVCFGALIVEAQIKLPEDCQRILETRFRSWKTAAVAPGIIEYYERERAFEHPNLIKGDWNGDGKTDYAVRLENKTDSEKKLAVVLMKSRSDYDTYFFDGQDCLMSVRKGEKDYDFDAQKSFRYKTDAIITCYWEKSGTSYIWEKGKFRPRLTSD